MRRGRFTEDDYNDAFIPYEAHYSLADEDPSDVHELSSDESSPGSSEAMSKSDGSSVIMSHLAQLTVYHLHPAW